MKSLTHSELISFCRQSALLLRSGISSLEGLTLMAEDTARGEGRQILQDLIHELEQNASLSDALRSVQVFPAYLCSMVELGEQTGRLDDVMESLARHYEREERLSKNIKSAVSYPLAMIAMMIIVIAILLVKVMPIFQQVYAMLGIQMSGMSGALLEFSHSLRNYSAVFLVVILAAVILFFCLFFTEKGRRKLLAFSHHFILTRQISRRIACSRFAGGMSLCLASGLEMDQSLEMSARLIDHPVVQEQIGKLRQDTARGIPFSEAVSTAGIFPGVYTRMLSIGSRAGASDEVMKQIADQYTEDIEESLDALVSRLEPTLVAILSVAAGMILLSVMLPLMGIMANMG